MVDAESAPDAAEVSTFQIEADCFTLRFFWIAEWLRLWRVDALTLFALVPLAAGARVAGFSLLL